VELYAFKPGTGEPLRTGNWLLLVLVIFDVHESMHLDTTMKITNKVHYID
jgi:hypothetical protein